MISYRRSILGSTGHDARRLQFKLYGGRGLIMLERLQSRPDGDRALHPLRIVMRRRLLDWETHLRRLCQRRLIAGLVSDIGEQRGCSNDRVAMLGVFAAVDLGEVLVQCQRALNITRPNVSLPRPHRVDLAGRWIVGFGQTRALVILALLLLLGAGLLAFLLGHLPAGAECLKGLKG